MIAKSILTAIALNLSFAVAANDQLVITSAHRQSVQKELIPLFKAHYLKLTKRKVDVSWLTQGGASDDLRLVMSRFQQNPKTTGIDIFWGGGEATFYDLHRHGLLEKVQINSEKRDPRLPANILTQNPEGTWFASAFSAFGIFYNKKLLKFLKIPEPKTWEDLSDSKLFGNIAVADPRHSSSYLTIFNVILRSLGWQKGWDTIFAIAGNTRSFTHTSSDPIKSVVAGDAAVGLAVNYFAQAKIGDLGSNNLGFQLPEGKTIVNSDPIGVLKGAPNLTVAKAFIEFILSTEAQKVLILRRGAPHGPKATSLGRMAVTPKAYDESNKEDIISTNPFTLKIPDFSFDMAHTARVQFVLADLIGATLVDTHKELKSAWKQHSKKPVKGLSTPFLSEKNLDALSLKWKDQSLRNSTINEWLTQAKDRYLKAAN